MTTSARADVPELMDLHQRLLLQDAAAEEAVVIALRPSLIRMTRRAFADTPREAIVDAVHDALIDYIRRPQRFDPDRGVPLHRYLEIAASRNMQDYRRRERRRQQREYRYARERLPIATAAATSTATHANLLRAALDAVCEPRELAAARAWVSGERRTSALASLLGASELQPPERAREVKRFKDRLLKRLGRFSNRPSRNC